MVFQNMEGMATIYRNLEFWDQTFTGMSVGTRNIFEYRRLQKKREKYFRYDLLYPRLIRRATLCAAGGREEVRPEGRRKRPR